MPHKTTHLTFLWCLLLTVQAHSQKIDSLKDELFRQDGSARFTVLYELVFEYLNKGDYPEALKYIDEAQQVAARFDDSLHIVKAGRVKGQTFRRLDRVRDAIDEFKKVLPISKRNGFISEYEFILNGLAIGYTNQGNYDKALQVLFECLMLREKKSDSQAIGVILNNIGLVYYKLQNFEKGLEYYGLARNFKSSFEDQLLINAGLCYVELGDFLTARRFFEEGMKLCAPNCSDETLTSGEFGLAQALFQLNKPKEAEKHFLLSYRLAQKRNDKQFKINNLYYLAKIKNEKGLFEEVKRLLAEAESIANETEYNQERMDIFTEYSELYIKTMDYKNASLYQGKYITLRDSIYSGELTKNLMRIQAEFEERENKAKIASQEQVLKLKELAIEKQRFLNLLVGTVAVLFVMLTLIFFKLSRQRKNMNVLLDRKVGERTLALEESLNELRCSNNDQEILLRAISSDMKASMATIRGLCKLSSGLEEVPGARIRYSKEFEETADRIAEIVNRVERVTKG